MASKGLAAVIWVVLAPLGGAAAAFEIDYPAVFAAHEADVMQAAPGKRQLELPGPVIVTEITEVNGSRRYVGVDQSGLGAVGCSFRILSGLVVVAGLCKGALTPDETAELDRLLLRTARFVGQNTVPPVAEAEIRPRLLDELRRMAEQYEQGGGLQCPDPQGATPGWAEVARNLVRPGGRAAVERALSRPRLPVINPCL